MRFAPSIRTSHGMSLKGLKKKIENANSWFASQKYPSVMFIDTTSRGELAYRFRGAVDKLKLRIKVVERQCNPIKSILDRTYPFNRTSCTDRNCIVCRLSPQTNYKCSLQYKMYIGKHDNKVRRGRQHEAYESG